MHLVSPAAKSRQVGFARSLFHIVALTVFPLLFGAPALRAENTPSSLAIGGARVPVVQSGDAEAYDCALTLAPGGPAHIYWGWHDAKNHYRVDLAPTSASLVRVLKGREDRLASTAGRFVDAAQPTPILLRRRTNALYVLVRGRVVLDALDSTFTAGPVAGARLTAGAFQPAEEISFSDDFMRTEAEQDLGQWTKAQGSWRFHSVKETNPSADTRLSVNPFSLGGEDPKGALVTVGYPFWSDYTFSASVKSAGAFAGIAFGCHKANDKVSDYYLLRLDLRGVRPAPSAVSLVRVSPRGEKVIASGAVRAACGEWYRVGVRTFGSRIQAILDGDVLFDVVDPQFTGGPVGLYTKGQETTFFDDVRVESTPVIAFDRAQALRRYGASLQGTWKFEPAPGARIVGDTGPHRLVENGPAPARYLFGDPGWRGGVIETRVCPEGSGWAGILFGYQDEENWHLARWRVTGASGGAHAESQLQLIRCVNGKKEVAADSPAGMEPGRWHDLQIDCSQAGYTHVSIDGWMRLRVAEPAQPMGRAGLYTLGLSRARFEAPTLRREREVQIEQQVANQVFKNDPFMRHWASPRGQWFPVAGTPNAYWNKGDFFNAWTIAMPLHAGMALTFGAETQEFAKGYRLMVARAEGNRFRVQLNRLDKEIKAAAVTRTDEDADLTLHRAGDVIWVTYGTRELFCFHDHEPLPGRRVGLLAPPDPVAAAAPAVAAAAPAAGATAQQAATRVRHRPASAAGEVAPGELDLNSLLVERENIADYPFEEASCDWEQYGTWVVTNRFSCTPTWSHMTAMSDHAAVIWNKYAFDGDMTLEFYAGMRMGSNPAMWYPRVGDLNATICGDGRDLSTGYSYLVGAWDPGWTEKWTRLLRGAAIVAQTDHYTVPRDREQSGDREIAVPWVAEGRPIHGAWYYMKICRVGKHIDCYFDNEKVLSFDDRGPLDGRFLALWTQMSQIVVARVRVTYEHRSAPHRLLPASAALRPGALAREHEPTDVAAFRRLNLPAAPRAQVAAKPVRPNGSRTTVPPAPVLTSTTHPGLAEDFERADSAWAPVSDPRDVAVERVAGGPAGSRAYLRVTNYSPGADLGVKLPVPLGLDAQRAHLAFDYRIPPQAKVNLYVTFGGRQHFIRLTGDGEDDPLLPCLGRIDVLSDGQWHHAEFDLGAAVAQRYAEQAPSPLPGSQQQTPVLLQLLDDPQQAGANPFAVQEMRLGYCHEGYLRAGIGGNGPGVFYGLDNFHIVSTTAAAPVLTWALPNKGNTAEIRGMLKLAAAIEPGSVAAPQDPPVTGAPTPVWAVSIDHEPEGEPSTTQPTRETRRAVEDLKDGLWYAHVRYRLPGGAWSQTACLPFEIANRKPVLKLLNVAADARWGGEPLLFRVEPADGPCLALSRLALSINGQKVENPQRLVSYDAGKHEMAVDLQHAGITFADKHPIKVTLESASLDGPVSSTDVALLMDYGRDSRPPTAPVIKTAGISEGFEEGIGGWAPSSALLVRDTSTAASGRASLRIENTVLASSFGATALSSAFNVGRTPLLRFAYRVPDSVCANIGLVTHLGAAGIHFTDTSDSYPLVGAIDGVKRDDQWHTAEVNLREAVQAMPFRPDQFEASSLLFSDRGYTGGKPGASYWIDDFQLVPVASDNAGIPVSWSATDCSGIKAYRYKWSAKADDTPDKPLPGAPSEYTFKDAPEGLSYLHLQAQDGAGNWGETAHLPFLVDNTPPTLAAPAAAPAKLSSSLWRLGLNDAGGAGIDPASLQVSINGKACPLSEHLTNRDASGKALNWEWPLASGLFSDPIPDGQPVEFTVAPVKDFAGNTSPGVTYRYTIDRAGDKEPPCAPTVKAQGNGALFIDTFTRDLGQWSVYGGGSAGVTRYLDPERQDYCLRLSPSASSYGFTARSTDFDAMKSPWIVFDYRCPASVALHFMCYINGTWYAIPLNGRSPSYKNVGQAPGFVADGKWHTIAINIPEVMAQGGVKAASLPISILALWHYGSGASLPYDIDNFQLVSPGAADLQANWQAADATGIEGYRYRLDPPTETNLDGGTETTQKQVSLTGLKPGLWFLRVRARDGAGNWSAPALLAHAVGG